MATLSRAALKLFFQTGDTPTEAQFADDIDSSPNIVDDFGSAPANIRRVVVTIPTAQVLTLFTVPVLLIPAPGPGFFIEVISAFVNILFYTTVYATVSQLDIQVAGSVQPIFSTNRMLDATASLIRPQLRLTPFAADQTIMLANAAVLIATTGVDPTLGDSDVKVYATFRIVAV